MDGKRLANVRKFYGETQKQLADFLYVSESTLRNWERGDFSPSHESLIKICRHYNVSADYLLGLTDDDENFLKARREQLTPENRKALKEYEKFLLWRQKEGRNP